MIFAVFAGACHGFPVLFALFTWPRGDPMDFPGSQGIRRVKPGESELRREK